MAKENYYAVAKGRKTGVFLTWAECEEQIKGFSGASYKKFNSKQEAEGFVAKYGTQKSEDATHSTKTIEDQSEVIDYNKLVINDLNSERVVAFVDGSFSDKGGEQLAGFGCYILAPNRAEPIEISDKVYGKTFISTRNIAPEIFGALEAIKWAVANEHLAITIYHDLEHTGKWARKEYEAKSDIAKLFIRELDEKYTNIIDISFKWVKGHAGIEYNERADQLASEAIRNQRKPIGKYGSNFFTGKNVSENEVNKIINLLKESDEVTHQQEELLNKGIKHTFTKTINTKKEKLTVTFFPKDRTTLLQGEVKSLFAEFLSYYTVHIPSFDMIYAYRNSYKVTIDPNDINQKITRLNLPSDYPQSAITLLKQSFVMLNLDREEYDYTHYTLPAYRALEGHLKYLFEKSGTHLSKNKAGGGHFNKDQTSGKFYLTNLTLKNHMNASKIESAYNLYNSNRHAPLHFGELLPAPLDTTLLISKIEDARDRIQEVLKEIQF